MKQTRRWLAPLVAVGVAALLVLGLAQALAGPSGIVVTTSGSWRLFKSTAIFTGDDGAPILTNTMASGRSRIRLAPGTYWLVIENPHQANCPTAEEYKVRPHHWTRKSSAFASHPCSIQ